MGSKNCSAASVSEALQGGANSRALIKPSARAKQAKAYF